MSKTDSKNVSIKIEGESLRIIEAIAEKECRSVTQQVRKIIQDYIESAHDAPVEQNPEGEVFK